MTDPADFTIMRWGLVYASVCTSLPREEATQRLNVELPTGVGPWHPAPDAFFAGGQTNPCPCEQVPERTHYLYSC